MATFSVWRFDSADGAERAAALLRELDGADDAVRDAAVVTWEAGSRRPRTRQVGAPAAGALGSGFWDLLFGLVFFVPLLGAAIGAPTGAITGSLADVGITDGFVNRVRDEVIPGTSALFLLAGDAVVDRVHDGLATATTDGVIRVVLGPDEEAALREVFAD